jgi:multicomponent K+:H+ antiporter subunit D
VALGRTGIIFFWKQLPVDEAETGAENARVSIPVHAPADLLPAVALLGISPLLVVFGGQIAEFAFAAADHVVNPVHYIEAVLGPDRSLPLLFPLGGE